MLKKISLKALSVLLALLIALPLLTTSLLPVQIAPEVKAAPPGTIVLDTTQGYVGNYITVTGSGFTPDKDVTFMWGDQLFAWLGFVGGTQPYQRPSIQPWSWPAQVHTDALGNFVVRLQVPKLASGTYTVKADDTTTSATASFSITPRVTLRNQYAYQKHGKSEVPTDNPSSKYHIEFFLAEGFVGDWLTLQLSGFGEGEVVEVMIGTTELDDFTVLSGTEEGYLFLTDAQRVPEMPRGDYTVTATGKISGITASTSFKVKPELFLATPLPRPTLAFPWVYSFNNFGLSWYSSVNASANSEFIFEATGLSGTSIQTVTITYRGGSPINCLLTGVLTIQNGSTQGISDSTVPFGWDSPFTEGNSPQVEIPSTIPSGEILDVTITTVGAGGSSFTFTKQLFSSSLGSEDTDGSLIWLEGDSAIASDGTSLLGTVDDVNEAVATGLSGSFYWPTIVYPTGSAVNRMDLDALYWLPLTPYDQSLTPVSFFDVTGDQVWNSNDPVYIDYDNSGDVTENDARVTQQTIGGTLYLPMTSVLAGDPDLNRVLVKFPEETRPSYFTWMPTWVYLDKYGQGYVSEGDTRISAVLFPWAFIWIPVDANGFFATTSTLPSTPGGGITYVGGLWNVGVGPNGVQAGNTVQMQITPSLEVISAPTSYQLTNYVTEGSYVEIEGKGFRGNEQLAIYVGGEYVTTTMTAFEGFFTTWIAMPALSGGEQSITAIGVTTGNTASTSVTFTPTISVSPTAGFNLNPVTSIMVTGKGFETDTYQIVIDGASIGEAVTMPFTVTDTGDEAGQINIAFNLPAGAEGAHVIDVVKTSDPTSSALYNARYFTVDASVRPGVPFPLDSELSTVVIFPSLQIMPTAATVGTLVAITGKGLQPNTAYYVWYDPRGTTASQAVLVATTPTTVTTDPEGTLTASFQIPQSTSDSHPVWVSTSNTFVNNDPVSRNKVSTWISLRSAMTLAQSSGPVGANVAVSFTGLYSGGQYQLWWYRPNEPKFAGEIPSTALLLTTVTGALYGNSTAAVSFTVPATAEGNTVYAVDLSPYGNRYTILANPVFFTVGKVSTAITISLTPTTVTLGETIAVNGFIEPAMSVDITLNIVDPDGMSTSKTVTSTSSGTFTDSFKPDKAGKWLVTADWNGDTVYAEYRSLASTAMVSPVDTSWMYTLTALGIGLAALMLGVIITISYFMHKKRVLAATPPA